MRQNPARDVPLVQGNAKHGEEKARPIIEDGEHGPLKVFHALKGDGSYAGTNQEDR